MKAFAFTDGSFGSPLHPDAAGAGWELLFYHDGVWEKESGARPLGYLTSHEEAEYRAALLALRRAREIGSPTAS